MKNILHLHIVFFIGIKYPIVQGMPFPAQVPNHFDKLL